jgi:hypothetical protein
MGDLTTDQKVRADEVAQRMVELLAQREPAEIASFAQPLWDLLAGQSGELLRPVPLKDLADVPGAHSNLQARDGAGIWPRGHHASDLRLDDRP